MNGTMSAAPADSHDKCTANANTPNNCDNDARATEYHAETEFNNSDEDGEKEMVKGREEHQTITVEQVKVQKLIYKLSDNPPLRLLLLFSLQQALLSVSAALSVSVFVSEVVCARDDGDFKIKILSATFLMIGLSTFCMSTFGVRLPIFQGPATAYIIPLFALTEQPDWQCPTQEQLADLYANSTVNGTYIGDGMLATPRDLILSRVQKLSGSLMLAGGLHFLIGATGLAGFLLRYIGPITIVPAITLVGLYIYKITVKFSETSWPVALLTAACGIVLSLYLSKRSSPIPAWNRERGLHIKWYPVHQVFAVLISIIIGWAVSAILTSLDLLSADRDSVQYYARTDTQLYVIDSTPWFSVPYPGQFGIPSFNTGVFLSFFLSTLLSVLDSIGDYSACARMCYVPQPPPWAFNRGLAVEGLMSLLSGGFAIGHATASYGGNIGAIGLTKVASRRVFQVVGVMYVIVALAGKIGAVFITVPYSVLGGTQIMTIGIFIGIVLSYLQVVDLGSTRNVAIIGISLLLGLMVPYWVGKTPEGVQTGNEEANRLIRILLSNPVMVGGFLACFMDNTIPGTLKERGISLEDLSGSKDYEKNGDEKKEDDEDGFLEGPEVYDIPWLPDCVQRSSLARVIRIFPGPGTKPIMIRDLDEA